MGVTVPSALMASRLWATIDRAISRHCSEKLFIQESFASEGEMRKGSSHARRGTAQERSWLLDDELDELGVGLGFAQAGDHGVGGFLDLLLHQGAAEEVDALEGLRVVDQQFLLAGAGGLDVD